MLQYFRAICPIFGHANPLRNRVSLRDARLIEYRKYLNPAVQIHKKWYSKSNPIKDKNLDLSEFPTEKVRNFSIIAHVDHGKSTLADRLLEYTGAISSKEKNEQVLDKLQVERERGITVKAQTASLIHEIDGTKYLLNLIDTPGHVDFHYEVSRSLAACEGVILLVDANSGVQAQTVANFYLAFEQELEIIPVMNKIDLKVARPDEVAEQIQNIFDVPNEDILRVSAKQGIGIDDVLEAVVKKIPPPSSNPDNPLKALIFDTYYDKYRGAVCMISVKDGTIRKGDKIKFARGEVEYEVQEVGLMRPEETKIDVLYAGHVGYLHARIKSVDEAQIGDTVYHTKAPVEPLPGFKPAMPMVFAGIFPIDQSQFADLQTSLSKLTMNDPSVDVNKDSSASLGQGWRLGFLGLLHLDVFCQRLEQEYDANVIITTPNVPYKIKVHGAKNIKHYQGEEVSILNPCHWPEPQIISEMSEPYVLATLITPDDYIGNIVPLILARRGEIKDQTYIDNKRLMYKVEFPLQEIVVDFFDALKSVTSGYASFDYEDDGYRPTDLVKLEVAFNGQYTDELSQIVHATRARESAKRIVAKLKDSVPRQLFEIAIQAKIGNKVVARETLKAYRKDVTAKCYGGDITRKLKLLKRQAEGKKRMRLIGKVQVPKEAFINVLKRT